MEMIQVEILNPSVGKILKNLADLKLISITKSSEDGFQKFINKLRLKAINEPITLEEITKEVETVREKRYNESK